jgi:plasmid stabilization system protein ParE
LRKQPWTTAAADDLESVSDYLHRNQPGWAQPTVRRIYEAASTLNKSPTRGRLGTEPGTRELKLPDLSCLIVFTVTDEAVEIVRVYHSAQYWLQ